MRRRKLAAKVEVRSDKKDVLSLVDHGQVFFMNRPRFDKSTVEYFWLLCDDLLWPIDTLSTVEQLNEAHLWFSQHKGFVQDLQQMMCRIICLINVCFVF
jgi:hypothetical protein